MADESFPSQARIVVIGGGVVGSAVAYHLAHLGARDAVLLERAKLGSGTSWHAAGNMETYREDPLLGEMISYAVDLYPRLERETGQALGWRQTGRVTFTTDPRRMRQYRTLPAIGEARGIEIELLSPAQVVEKLPIAAADGLAGGIWVPSDGRINPTDLAVALAKGARQLGVRVFEDTPATGIETERGRIKSVRTGAGVIECEVVVNAAGLWADQVGKLCGAPLPLHALEHFYFLTEALEEVDRDMPLFLSYEELMYGREDVGGLLFGFLDRDAVPIAPEALPADFSFGLLPEPWAQAEPYLALAMHRFPVLESAGIRMLLNGPESFTPDGNMLLGEVPGVHGLYVAAAMNSNGIALSAGAGKLTAEWIVEGAPSLDASRLDVRRFSPFQATRRYIRRRAQEVPSYYGALRDPGEDYRNARGVRRTPLYERLAAAGARFATDAGWECAAWFEREGSAEACIAGEHRAASEAVVLVDASADSAFRIAGRDAGDFLAALTSGAHRLPVGAVGRALFLNARGGVEADCVAMRGGEREWWLLAAPDQQVGLGGWLRSHLDPSTHIDLDDCTSAWAAFELIGPHAGALLSRCGLDELPRQALIRATIGFSPVLAHGDPVQENVRLLTPTEHALAVWDRLMCVSPGLRLAGFLARDRWRVCRRLPRFGKEFDPFVSAVAAGLGPWLDADGDAYVDREASMRAPERGEPVIRAFSLEDGGPTPVELEPVWTEGRSVGHVTSTAPMPDGSRIIVLAFVSGPESCYLMAEGGPRPLLAL